MSYTVLARKYRPQSFDELVGQEHVARTIANAIAQDRVAHAFLFTGVRGVGKTTTARLLAKSLNCEQGPTATPCNTCGPCVDITSGRDVDVQEIDGASNNGVDDVRRLQETLPFRPARDRFKIVIVDEVHMLSTGAFNAFLKTLEEPPPHVKFIFATTESHKVPITIRSRCQRYDFRLIPQAEVSARVREVLGKEGISADEATVAIVAREAAGSMRDALTLLDQLVAFGGTELVGSEVARVLGIAAREQVRSLVAGLVTGDARAVLEQVRAAELSGADPLHFGRQLLETLRDLVVFRITGDEKELVDWVSEERAFAADLVRTVEGTELSRLFAMATKVVDDVARSATPALSLEMGMLRVASRPRLGSLEELVAKLEALEAKLARSDVPSGGSGAGGPRGGGPGPSRPSSSGTVRSASAAEENIRPPEPEAPRESAPFALGPAAATAAEEVRPAPNVPPSERMAPEAPEAREPRTSSAPPTITRSAPPAEGPAPGLRRAALLDWAQVVKRVRDTHPALAAIIEQGEARLVSAEKIVVAFQEGSFYGRQASQPQSIDAIANAALAVLGGRPVVEIKLDLAAGAKTRTLADVEKQRREAEVDARRRSALGHPAVLDALDVFPEARGNAHVKFDGES